MAVAARGQQRRADAANGSVHEPGVDDPDAQPHGALLQGLQQFGWIIGRNLRVDYRWDDGVVTASADMRGFVAPAPDVIVALPVPLWPHCNRRPRIIPIVFVGGIDPVGAGLVPVSRGRAATPPGLPV